MGSRGLASQSCCPSRKRGALLAACLALGGQLAELFRNLRGLLVDADLCDALAELEPDLIRPICGSLDVNARPSSPLRNWTERSKLGRTDTHTRERARL